MAHVQDLAGLIKRLAWDAAWHAANTRSMMWKDAAKDIRTPIPFPFPSLSQWQ